MKKVLVIEDNPDNLRLITYPLQRCGYEVVSAVTGEDGVDMALLEEFAFILMDIDLPGMNGVEATIKIRSSEKRKTVPIIAITSYAMLGDREKILAAGCNGYFEKPIDPLAIMEKIHKIVNSE
jgi:CheY-like chemotaxis protein